MTRSDCMSKDFEVGDYVRIKSSKVLNPSYGGKYSGCEGTVCRFAGSRIGVLLEGKTNDSSIYGAFWFKSEELKFIKKRIEETKEEYFMDKNYHPVIINFVSGLNTNVPYIYAAYEDYAEGDYIVVHTGHHGMAIAKVKAIGTEDDKVEYGREIICKIDMSAYNERKARAKRRAELKDMMDSAVKDFQDMTMYEMIAAKNPEFAKLLEEFKELG